jgi:hypothetical protein
MADARRAPNRAAYISLPSLALWLGLAAAAAAFYWSFVPAAKTPSPSELIARGLSLVDGERFGDALVALEAALAAVDSPPKPVARGSAPTPTPLPLAPALLAIGRARLALGNATGAIPPLERSLLLLGGEGVRAGAAGASKDELRHAPALQLLGEALCALPEEENSARIGRSALARAYKLRKEELVAARAALAAGGPAPAREARAVAALEIALCSANQQIGDSERAISYGRKAFAFYNATDGLANISTANAANLVSVALSVRGTATDLEEAERVIRLVLNAINSVPVKRGPSGAGGGPSGAAVLQLEASHCALFLRLGRAVEAVSRCSSALPGAEAVSGGRPTLTLGKLHAYTGAAQAELKRWEASLESAARAAEILGVAAGERSKHVQNAFVTLDRAFSALTGKPLPPAKSVAEGIAAARAWRSHTKA